MFLIDESYMPWRALNKEAKGQIISKCLFGVLNSSKKRTKTIRLKLRIEDTKKTFQN